MTSLRNPQSAIRNPQSAIRNPQSAIRTWSAVLALIALGAAQDAYAIDGTITINGELTDSTCVINGGHPNRIVTLPKVSTSAIQNVNDVAGATMFDLVLSNCPELLNGQEISAYFEPGRTTDYASNNLRAFTPVAGGMPGEGVAATEAANVQILISQTNGSKILMGRNVAEQNAPSATVSARGATLRYLAKYIRTGAGNVAAGTMVTTVGYSIVYP